MTQTEVIDLMRSSKSQKEWDANCDKIKENHNGVYPSFWFQSIILPNLYGQVKATWEPKNSFRITPYGIWE